MAEHIPLQEAVVQSQEIVRGNRLDNAKGTLEDPDAVRSRLVATQVHTYAFEDVTQATPPIKAFRIIVSQVSTKTIAKDQHDLFDRWRRHESGVFSCEGKRASRYHPTSRNCHHRRLEMCESVVRNT